MIFELFYNLHLNFADREYQVGYRSAPLEAAGHLTEARGGPISPIERYTDSVGSIQERYPEIVLTPLSPFQSYRSQAGTVAVPAFLGDSGSMQTSATMQTRLKMRIPPACIRTL